MAKRYGCLPSQALASGWSIDVQCAIRGAEYEAYQQKVARGEKPIPNYSQEELSDMLERVKNANVPKGS